MSVRDYLYGNFENFDKPTEDEFRVFIDFAGVPTTFENRTITPVTNILTDINAEVFVLEVRDTYIIFYGSEVHILFGLEGTYGLGGLTITSSNLALIGNASSGALTSTLTANTSIPNAGIEEGDSFPVGTSFEEMWNALLVKTTISNLRYAANDTTGFIKVGEDLDITRFSWDVVGTPENLYLEDSDGQYSEAVTGNQVGMTETYTYASYKELVWTLTSSNTPSITVTNYWVEPSYYNRSSTDTLPTASEILAGVEVLSLTEDGITVPINTVIAEYGWIAVENTQAAGIYSRWWITEFNTAEIKANSFIRYEGNVNVSGKIFNVYMYNYPSQVITLKLY